MTACSDYYDYNEKDDNHDIDDVGNDDSNRPPERVSQFYQCYRTPERRRGVDDHLAALRNLIVQRWNLNKILSFFKKMKII